MYTCQAIALTFACAIIAPETWGATFVPLADLPGGQTVSIAMGVSYGGDYAVGQSENALHEPAAIWSHDGSGSSLPLLRNVHTMAGNAVSADGSVIVGDDLSSYQAVVWNGNSVSRIFTPGQAGDSSATAVSTDGTYVAGRVFGYPISAPHTDRAFRWSEAHGIELLSHDSTYLSFAEGISGDGSKVVGALGGPAYREGFIWMPGSPDSLQLLGAGTSAMEISPDGGTVVGRFDTAIGGEAFIWKASSGVVLLGDLPGGDLSSIAWGVSDGGTVVVGRGHNGSAGFGGLEAFYWTASVGMRRLAEVLQERGALGIDGWHLVDAMGVSANGETIVGWGYNSLGQPQGFMATIEVVPLPSAVWLFSCAVGALACMRIRATRRR